MEVMIEHIIKNHTKKDKSNKFACDDCSYKCESRDKLLAHFRKEHKKKSAEQNKNVGNEVPNDLEEEHRLL